MAKRSEPSGINTVAPPPPGATPSEATHHYLDEYEDQYRRARRTVKRRASGVTIATAILTGTLAVLGSIGALFATDWLSAALAVITTATSAAVSVLLAWNDHFHHRELWIQRSAVLAEINELRRRFDVRSRLPWYLRRNSNFESIKAMEELDQLLKRDLDTWTRLQTNAPSGGK